MRQSNLDLIQKKFQGTTVAISVHGGFLLVGAQYLMHIYLSDDESH